MRRGTEKKWSKTCTELSPALDVEELVKAIVSLQLVAALSYR
jgi:hypothetical protein